MGMASMLALVSAIGIATAAPLVNPANDTNCHTGRGHIVGVKFCGMEIKTVDVADLGHCCEACAVQMTTPGATKKCSFISFDSDTKKCTLSTGQGGLCGQKNSITNSYHGQENPSPSPPPPPPPPLADAPCIRFGHALPVSNAVDAMIVSDEHPDRNYTWTNMKFGDFSDWVNVLPAGKGTITVWESVGGKRGKQLYQLSGIPLTPGPLVAALKAPSEGSNSLWPPNSPHFFETIAASYVQSASTSKVRLFNLSPDTKAAGLTSSLNGTTELASNVQYSLGSSWVNVATAATTWGVIDDLTKKKLATFRHTPPAAPLGFSNMLIGLQAGKGATAIRVVPLADAPEGGVCHP